MILLLAGMMFSLTFMTHAQSSDVRIGNGELGIHCMMVFPQGDFKKHVDDLGFGLNVDLGYVFPTLPIVAGLEGGYAVYGSKTFRTPFSTTISVVDVEVSTTNAIGLGHVFVRFQPQQGMFRPYFEGLLGGCYLATTSSAKNYNTDEEIAGSTNKDDIAFSYGGGGGLMFKVYEESGQNENGKSEILIDLRLRFLYGGEATYYRSDAVYQESGTGAVKFDANKGHTSKTDLLTAHIGVVVRL